MFASWRSRLSEDNGKPRLLVPPDESLEAFKARSKLSTSACGVSLAFLGRFRDTLEELKLEQGKARSTQALVARLLSPAGVVHLPAPDPKSRRSLDTRPMSRSMTLKGFYASGATTTRERSSTPHGIGFKEMRTRVWDFIEPEWCGKPDYYVCHAWSGDFLEMLEAVADRILRQPEHNGSDDEDEDQPLDPNNVFVWLDVFALPQQYLGGASAPEGPQFGPPHSLISMQEVRDIVAGCERGTVIVLDRAMAVLGRAWPLYEVWLAAYYTPPDTSASRVFAAIPKDIHVDMLLHLQMSCLAGIDLGRATTSKPEDKQHIMTEVRHAAGQKRVQNMISDTILRAARGWLRWSGDAGDIGLYSALMLQSKEYAQLQYVLNAVDEIHDDEATLKEIRDLFVLYDEDGTGSLEEDEFAQVLAMAGFGAEEAHSIFAQVDTDGGGSVDLEEFEAWWIESQRQHNRNCRKKPELTVNGLVNNLQGLVAMLQRRNAKELANTITYLIAELQASAAGPKSPFPDGVLPPSEVYGDWRAVANTLGFRITFNDLRPALRMLHTLLLANVDTLALDANPASQLPSPNTIGTDIKLQKAVLAWFMSLMAELLSRNPQTLREADFFLREAIDISLPEKQKETAHSASRALDAAIQKAKKDTMTAGRNDFEMESIVTNMVRLKHGKDTIVSNRLVAEANISLSAWMASSKEKAHAYASKNGGQKAAGGKGPDSSSIAAFTTNYLGAGAAGTDASNNAPEASSASGEGKSGLAVNKNTPRKGPYEGMTHLQLARALGAACRAALKEHKTGRRKVEEDGTADDETSDSEKDGSDDEAPNGRISPLKMASMMKDRSTPEKGPAHLLADRSPSSLNGKKVTSLNGSRVSTPDKSKLVLGRSRTLADRDSSYTASRRHAAGSVEPQTQPRLYQSRLGSSTGGSVAELSSKAEQGRAHSSLAAPMDRPAIPRLRHMPLSGDLSTAVTPRDKDSSDEEILKSVRQRRGSSGPYMPQVREQDLPSSQDSVSQHPASHNPHAPLPSNQHPSQPHPASPPQTGRATLHPRPPLLPQPHRPHASSHLHPSAHPQGHATHAPQEPEGGGDRYPVLDHRQSHSPETRSDDEEVRAADEEVKRSLDIGAHAQPARVIQAPLAGTMRARPAPGSGLGTYQQQQQQVEVQPPQASGFFSLPWGRTARDSAPQQQQQQSKLSSSVVMPMLEKVKGIFGPFSKAAAAVGVGQSPSQGPAAQPKAAGLYPQPPLNPPPLAGESSSASLQQHRVPSSNTRPPSMSTGQHRVQLHAHANHRRVKNSVDEPPEPATGSPHEAHNLPPVQPLMHSGFAQRFATVGAQQRAVTPSTHNLVGTSELEALRNRRSMAAGTKEGSRAGSRSRAGSPVGNNRANSPLHPRDSSPGHHHAALGRESSLAGLRERGPMPRHVGSSASNAPGEGHWTASPPSPPFRPMGMNGGSNSTSGQTSVELNEHAVGRPGSRLRNATTAGFSQMATRGVGAPMHNTGAGTKSKWFSQFAGTSLPSLQRPQQQH